MATTWIVRPALWTALFAVGVAGCGKSAETKPASPTPKADSPDKMTGPTPKQPPAPVGVPAEADDAAKAFLAATAADPSKLTAGFKKLIAPAATDAAKADWEAEQYLANRVVGKAGTLKITYALAPDTVVATTAVAVLKLVKDPNGWLVDWIHVGPPGDRTWPVDPTGSAFVTAAFLDCAITQQSALVEAVLSPTLKAKLAPPSDDVDRARGYNQGILRLKLSAFRGSSTDYKTETVNVGEATGKLGDGRAFTVKLAKGSKPGEWLVDDFQPQ